jgi:hypothetical protein
VGRSNAENLPTDVQDLNHNKRVHDPAISEAAHSFKIGKPYAFVAFITRIFGDETIKIS